MKMVNVEHVIKPIPHSVTRSKSFVYINMNYLCLTNLVACCRSGSPVSRKSVSGSEAGSPVHEKGSGRQNLMNQKVYSGTYSCTFNVTVQEILTFTFAFARQKQFKVRNRPNFVTIGRSKVSICILEFLSFRIWNRGKIFW
jgi:hypothetical protein